MESKEILCTLGPASVNEITINRFEGLNVSLFRINLSHTKLEDLRDTVNQIRSFSQNTPICLDSEGAQVRTGSFADGKVHISENSVVRIYKSNIQGDVQKFTLFPINIIDQLRVNDFLSIDFNSVLGQIINIKEDHIEMKVVNGGIVGSNKAVTVDRALEMSALTDKDKEALSIGKEMGIKHVALSFASCGSDVDAIREYSGDGVFVISKIESRKGLANLKDIANRSDAILIDRGDLSREQPIERIPILQKAIIKQAKACDTLVYVATNLLETMVEQANPTRAEVNDIYNTLADGADGLVLAAETAIGKYPVRAVGFLRKVIDQYVGMYSDPKQNFIYDDSQLSLLPKPHGGELLVRIATEDELSGLSGLKKIKVRDTDLSDCEQMAVGVYSPLKGFMDRENLSLVLQHNKLSNGEIWTLPVVLQVDKICAADLEVGQRVILADKNGVTHSYLDISDIYTMDLGQVAEACFGTTSVDHPGVMRLLESGDYFLGGEVTLIEPKESAYKPYELTPAQTRYVFNMKGWTRVVGFHRSGVADKADKLMQMSAIEKVHADGLFIFPVTGCKGATALRQTAPIIESYQASIESGEYPSGQVLLGGFTTYARHAGAREMVFTAICHKNMGCSHFIVGGEGAEWDADQKDASVRSFSEIGDIGITPLFF
jgi:pyruvate kinase